MEKTCIDSVCNFLAGLLHGVKQFLEQHAMDIEYRFEAILEILVRFLRSQAELKAWQRRYILNGFFRLHWSNSNLGNRWKVLGLAFVFLIGKRNE